MELLVQSCEFGDQLVGPTVYFIGLGRNDVAEYVCD